MWYGAYFLKKAQVSTTPFYSEIINKAPLNHRALYHYYICRKGVSFTWPPVCKILAVNVHWWQFLAWVLGMCTITYATESPKAGDSNKIHVVTHVTCWSNRHLSKFKHNMSRGSFQWHILPTITYIVLVWLSMPWTGWLKETSPSMCIKCSSISPLWWIEAILISVHLMTENELQWHGDSDLWSLFSAKKL